MKATTTMESPISHMHDGVTILDVLGVDTCRQIILEYIDFRDVMRTETVSRRWQYAIREYLKHPRTLALELNVHDHNTSITKTPLLTLREKFNYTFPWHCRTWDIYDRNSKVNRVESHCAMYAGLHVKKKCWKITLRRAVQKWGPFITSFSTDHKDINFYKKVIMYCPHLRFIEFKYVSLCDEKIIEVLQDKEWNEIKMISNNSLTGQFLNSIKSDNLKSLCLIKCRNLDIKNLASAADHMKNVTNLDLSFNGMDILMKIHILLNKMPQIQNLSLQGYNTKQKRIKLSDELIKCFSRLTHLKRLDLKLSYLMNDELLKTLATRCNQLEYINMPAFNIGNCFYGLAEMISRSSVRILSLHDAVFDLLNVFAELEAHTGGKVTRDMLNEAYSNISDDWVYSFQIRMESSTTETNPKVKIVIST